ncbi:MAG: amino acid ABC transporter ATP-binding protein [Thiomicrorhabdus sp.]|jgi:polar amino acid transport system ATP-binding protein|nr:amino acid ABC transporter ATP-binding protein [Thiomicrorhabdus sp.]
MSSVLKIENLHKSFGKLKVLDGVSLELNRGETKVIIGPSGTGKSTLLGCVNRLIEPDEGKIWISGDEITDDKNNMNRIRTEIGFVFQEFNLFTHLTALDNVRIGLQKVRKVTKKAATDRAMEELARVGLTEKAAMYPAELSGGQKQRVSIARALAMDPKVMLFDEPTSALDPELIGEVLNVMIQLAKDDMSMLIVSHEMGFARAVSDEIIFMEHGNIIEQGPPSQLFTYAEKPRTKEFLYKLDDLFGKEKETSP